MRLKVAAVCFLGNEGRKGESGGTFFFIIFFFF
jgi:hypothetical protein